MSHDDMHLRVRFGPFEVDFHTQELWKFGTRLKLAGQPLQVLEILISRPGELISREELRKGLWPEDTFVDFRHGLNAAVNKLRETLGDSADDPKYIETLPRRGYRFIGQIEQPVAEPEETRSTPVPEKMEPAFANFQPPAPVAMVEVAHPVARPHGRRWQFALIAFAAIAVSLVGSGFVFKLAQNFLGDSAESSKLNAEAKNLLRDMTTEIIAQSREVAQNRERVRKSMPLPPPGREPQMRNTVAAEGDVPLIYVNSSAQFRTRPLLVGNGANSAPQFSPDGKHIAFMSDRSGKWQIWVSDADGSNAKQLSFTDSAGTPRWSPDGSSIVFDAPLGEVTHVFIARAATGEARPLSKGLVPSFSRDGKWVYFASDRNAGWQVWKVPATGGDAVQLTTQGGFAALEASDGYVYYAKSRMPNPELWRVHANGGEEARVPVRFRPRSWASWTVTSAGILFAEDTPTGRPALSIFNPAKGEVRDLMSLDSGPFWLGATKDARKIVMDQEDRRITMLERFQ